MSGIKEQVMKRANVRITGWDYDNPPEVERAFRHGFLKGALKGLSLDRRAVLAAYRRVMKARGDLYWGGPWCDVKAARLRGISHGLWYLQECRESRCDEMVITRWLCRVKAWAVAELPKRGADGRIRGAMPPEPRQATARD